MAAENDNADLEALFDSIVAQGSGAAAGKAQPQPQPQSAPMPPPMARASADTNGDSDDLQSLFDRIVAEKQGAATGARVAAVASAVSADNASAQEKAFNSIGQLVRQLHEALLGLGYDKLLEKTAAALPDAKDRLAYIANLTEQAACRVLNATDIAMPLQEQLGAAAGTLGGRWDRVYKNELSVPEFKVLADETRAFLKAGAPEKIAQTNAQLMEIMMAQDFQDLTGQVIKKIVVLTQEMESSMMSVLIEIMPEMRRTEQVKSLLNGPVINAQGKDVVASQRQVDELLGSLGF